MPDSVPAMSSKGDRLVDMYGFVVPDDLKDLFLDSFNRHAELAEKQQARWSKLLAHMADRGTNDSNLTKDAADFVKRHKLNDMVRLGLPTGLRGSLWFAFALHWMPHGKDGDYQSLVRNSTKNRFVDVPATIYSSTCVLFSFLLFSFFFSFLFFFSSLCVCI
eukprot:Rmarinus@m.4003